jgi:hypothetical protein
MRFHIIPARDRITDPMFDWRKPCVPDIPPVAVTRDLRGDGWHVQLDLSPQLLSLAIPNEMTFREGEDELAPTCGTVLGGSAFLGRMPLGFVSASMLALKAKLFDDGLCAAAELAAQPSKEKLLAPLVDVAPVIAAAVRLGGLDAPSFQNVESVTEAFLANELASKPLGFYTWSAPLRRIFQQDRLLQQELTPSDVAAVTATLNAAPTLKAAYSAHLDFVSKLTNPPVSDMPDLRQPNGRYFFPPSQSHESVLATRLYGDRYIPDGWSLADEVLRQLRDGSLTVDPTDASGWYDFQTWALEPLVALDRMPEGARLTIDDGYRRQLDDLFKAILALTREAHVKQLMVPRLGAAMRPREVEVVVRVTPELTIEPTRTYYERRAVGYEFVRRVLESLGPLRLMYRMTDAGPVTRPLDEELEEMTALFRGAAAVAGEELGMEKAEGPEAARFRAWATEPDIADDVRMMVPVFFDHGRAQSKVWAILGWATRRLMISYVARPIALVLKGRARVEFHPASRVIAYPVFAEAYVSRVLDRDEFRAHCDRYKTPRSILEHL